MIELKIFDLLSTIGTGTVTLIAFLYCYFITLQLFDMRKHNCDVFITWVKNYLGEDHKQSGYTLLVSILIFSLGVMMEDFTDHLADSEVNRNPIISEIKSFNLLETEGALRAKALYVDPKTLSKLGKDVFNNKSINTDLTQFESNSRFFNTTDASDYWKEKGDSILKDPNRFEVFKDFVNGIYYTAKNWCYLQSNPTRSELEEIQTRIDLARSLVIIALLLIIVVLFLYMIYYINEAFIKTKHRFIIVLTKETSQGHKTTVRKKVFYPFRAIALLILIFAVTRLSYEVAENNFNERVFGYYISHLKLASHENGSQNAVR